MYPGTIVRWHDNSAIPTDTAGSAEQGPVFLVVSSFDKGPEKWNRVYGQAFFDLYGSKMNFKRHGQPAIQAANMINNGGTLLVKRLVASDATLANLILVAKVTSTTVATAATAEDDNAVPIGTIVGENSDYAGDPEALYVIDTDSSSVVLNWSAVSVAGITNGGEILEQAEALRVDTDAIIEEDGDVITVTRSSDYPLIVLSDNGRGASNKSVKISPDYTASNNLGDFFYMVYIYEGTQIIEKISATMNPDSIYGSTAYGLSQDSGMQITFLNVEGCYDAFVDHVAAATGISATTLKGYDLINMHTNKNAEISGITVDPESVDLDSAYGINLENGSNGEFGTAPWGTEAYTEAAIEALDGSFDDCIYDVDEYKIAACFDANYPIAVKDAIAELVTFREDFFFFRDCGTEVKSYNSIVAKIKEYKLNNKFIGNYLTTYQIYDPNTRKRIRVTMMYDFAAAMISHFETGPYRPCAGMANNMYLDSAIDGTVNYTPRITPSVNQKELLEDLRINYAIFQQGRCVVQSLYTTQEAYTQLTYINNVLAVQQVVRALRTFCPRYRYTFVSGNDFSVYEEACNNVLSYYTANFAELSMSYQQDAIQAAQKIFYAVINFRFNNWAQTEIFDLYALPTDYSNE